MDRKAVFFFVLLVAGWLWMRKPKAKDKQLPGSRGTAKMPLSKDQQKAIFFTMGNILSSNQWGPNPAAWSGKSPAMTTGIFAATARDKEAPLGPLLALYAKAGGKFSKQVAAIGDPNTPQKRNQLLAVLAGAASDKVWRDIQTDYFIKRILTPAWATAASLRFKQPSTYLIIALMFRGIDDHKKAAATVTRLVAGHDEKKAALGLVDWWEAESKKRGQANTKLFWSLRGFVNENPGMSLSR